MWGRIAVYLVGLAINTLGCAIVIFSAVGAGAWDAVAIGLNNHLNLTIGTCVIGIQTIVIVTTGIIERKRLQYGSIIPIIIRSIFLDVWIYLVFQRIQLPSAWEILWPVFIIGIIFMGVGIGIYVEARFPNSPIDGLMLAIHNRYDWSINVSRIVVELAGILIAFLLGGTIGLGTVIIAIFLGKIIQFSNTKVKIILNQSNTRYQRNPVKLVKEDSMHL